MRTTRWRRRRRRRGGCAPAGPWRWPAGVALLTAAGLAAALVTEGAWDAAWSALLAVPVVLAVWFGLRSPR